MAYFAIDPVRTRRERFATRRKEPWSWIGCFPPTTRSLAAFRFHFGQNFSPSRVCPPKDARNQLCTSGNVSPMCLHQSKTAGFSYRHVSKTGFPTKPRVYTVPSWSIFLGTAVS
jgi:hypothetical protein